ncbi:MAG: hypothetical protein WCP09_02325 [Candidatus Taylorbacteria bacterium]
MALEKRDIEIVESIVYKNADDIAVSIARSFERLEERIDSAESRLYSRMADIEDAVTEVRDLLKEEEGEDLDLE